MIGLEQVWGTTLLHPSHKGQTDTKRTKDANFHWIRQLSANDVIAENTVKPVKFMSGVISGKIWYGVFQLETDR